MMGWLRWWHVYLAGVVVAAVYRRVRYGEMRFTLGSRELGWPAASLLAGAWPLFFVGEVGFWLLFRVVGRGRLFAWLARRGSRAGLDITVDDRGGDDLDLDIRPSDDPHRKRAERSGVERHEKRAERSGVERHEKENPS